MKKKLILGLFLLTTSTVFTTASHVVGVFKTVVPTFANRAALGGLHGALARSQSTTPVVDINQKCIDLRNELNAIDLEFHELLLACSKMDVHSIGTAFSLDCNYLQFNSHRQFALAALDSIDSAFDKRCALYFAQQYVMAGRRCLVYRKDIVSKGI